MNNHIEATKNTTSPWIIIGRPQCYDLRQHRWYLGGDDRTGEFMGDNQSGEENNQQSVAAVATNPGIIGDRMVAADGLAHIVGATIKH